VASGAGLVNHAAGSAVPQRLEIPGLAFRRLVFGGLVALTTVLGTAMMVGIVRAGGFTLLELALLTLFVPTFAWIAIAFWNAVVGFVLELMDRDALTLTRRRSRAEVEPPRLDRATAVVMPAYHEDPRRLVRNLGAVARSLAETGQGAHFTLFLLSDSTDPSRFPEEEAAVEALATELGSLNGAPALHYRRRPKNEGRKAGNIQEFCDRWGDDFDHMAVLDADSVMTGPVLVELAGALERHPGVGLVQTVPLPAYADTRFGRLLQYGAALYSPMLAAGQAFWTGDTGNYWGHNAMLRVEAFARHARLPVLSGTPPLGGEILSHDFVEAALLRRGGWRTLLLPHTGGSWEEVPGNVVDYARRDRRWAQGSLQHLRLLLASGFHPLSRLHFFLGAMGYVASLLWLLLLLASTAYVVAPGLSENPLVPVAPEWTGMASAWTGVVSLLVATAVILFLPKVLGLALAMLRRRRSFGGVLRLAGGGAVEFTFSVVVAPVMMMYHSAFVLAILFGRTVPWGAQDRDGRSVSWREALVQTASTVVVGLAWAGLTWTVSPLFFAWLTPILLGLVLATPLVRLSSRQAPPGSIPARLLTVPWERRPPPELADPPAGFAGAGEGDPESASALPSLPEEAPSA